MSKIIALIVLFLLPSVALACSCSGAPTEERFAGASAVVIAEATAVSTRTMINTPERHVERQTVLWTVLKAWKGSYSAGETFTTRTESECCTCGLTVSRRGTLMLLYLSGREPYSLSTCAGHKFLDSDVKDILLLDKLQSHGNGT